MDYYKIGQRIRKYRRAHGLSQEALAEQVNISTTHMSHIETGSTKLSLQVLVDLSRCLGVRTDELLFDSAGLSNHSPSHEIISILEGCDPQQAQFLSELVRSAKLSMEKYL